MAEKIEFVFFDLGNVIVNFDHARAGENISKLAPISASLANQIIFESDLQTRYESGTISTDQFVSEFNAAATTTLDSGNLCCALSDIFRLNRAIIPLITQLNLAAIPMAVLSNTCSAHWEFVLARFPIVDQFFGGCENVLSFVSHSMKPDDKIYRDAIAIANCAPKHIFFMDDRPENVESAQKNGFQSELFDNTIELARYLQSGGIKINF